MKFYSDNLFRISCYYNKFCKITALKVWRNAYLFIHKPKMLLLTGDTMAFF